MPWQLCTAAWRPPAHTLLLVSVLHFTGTEENLRVWMRGGGRRSEREQEGWSGELLGERRAQGSWEFAGGGMEKTKFLEGEPQVDALFLIYCRRGSKPPNVPHCVPRASLCPPSLSSPSYNSTQWGSWLPSSRTTLSSTGFPPSSRPWGALPTAKAS